MGSKSRLNRLFASERRSFLRRSRKHWGNHISRAREFIGSALTNADPERPVLILGAGWGLEIPWHLAPAATTGWDADPFSRLGTFISHRRWPPWVFGDITGALAELDRVSRRVQYVEGKYTLRPTPDAAKRLAGLMPSVIPSSKQLDAWIQENHPGTIICANILGQIRPLAYKVVESAFKPRLPWQVDQDLADPLQNALEAWTARTLRAILDVLRKSGSSLYLLHDRGVINQDADLALGQWADSWLEQLNTSESCLEIIDPLSGIDFLKELCELPCQTKKRWIWHLGPGQTHVVEALAYSGKRVG